MDTLKQILKHLWKNFKILFITLLIIVLLIILGSIILDYFMHTLWAVNHF